MQTMRSATVISLDGRRERGRRMARAAEMRRGLEFVERRSRTRAGGRAWINGQELGGSREPLEHLGAVHD